MNFEKKPEKVRYWFFNFDEEKENCFLIALDESVEKWSVLVLT